MFRVKIMTLRISSVVKTSWLRNDKFEKYQFVCRELPIIIQVFLILFSSFSALRRATRQSSRLNMRQSQHEPT